MLAISTVFLFAWSAISLMGGNEVNTYHRFEKNNGKTNQFNWWALLSPVQTESQHVLDDTLRFKHKVVYPIGPHFEVVPPSNDTSENFVAQEIAQVIFDSLNRIFINSDLDYDQQSTLVRNAVNPENAKLKEPKIFISLFGTASPEAEKYGFKKSLEPGNFEKENRDLAHKRLERTDSLILKNLTDLGITNVIIRDVKSQELQLNSKEEVAKVMQDKSVLDTMRFVEASVVIATERLFILPIIAPIALPFWIGLISLLIWLLSLLFEKHKLPPPTKLSGPISLPPAAGIKKSNGCLYWIILFFAVSALILAIILSLPIYTIIAFLIGIVIILYLLLKEIGKIRIGKIDFGWFRLFLLVIWLVLENWFIQLFRWVRDRTLCQKVLIGTLLLHLVFLITWLAGLWMICFP